MNDIIKIVGLSKQFEDYIVLKNIYVNFKNGKIYGIIGRNGSGKSVLLKCILGLLPYDSGKITINNKQIGKEINFPPSVGFIINKPKFLSNVSAYNNLKYLASIKNEINKDDIEEILKLVSLSEYRNKKVGKFSMGMEQRLGIAQAIMENPNIIILDEPMNGLDNDGVDDIHKILLSLKSKEKLIVIASHNKEDIDVLCDEVYKMEDGTLKLQKNEKFNKDVIQ